MCQQLKRNAIGIDINKDYIDLCNERLSQPFLGFYSIDKRMERIPNDLNNKKIREKYIKKSYRMVFEQS